MYIRRAFTLVELVIVMAMVAILAAMLMPVLVSGIGRSRRVTCASQLHQIGVAFQVYLNDYNQVYPWAEDPVSVNPYYWFWMGRGWRKALEPYVGGAEVLYCPSDETAPHKWESTSYGYSMAFYHSPEQIDEMTSPADTYLNPRPSIPQKAEQVAFPTKKVMVAEWLSNHLPVERDSGWWCWLGARNCLFADGHVDFVRAVDVLPANDGYPDFNLTRHGIRGKDLP